MPHSIQSYDLPGIARGRQRRLMDAGMKTLEDLILAGADKVGAIPHIPEEVAAKAVDVARSIVPDHMIRKLEEEREQQKTITFQREPALPARIGGRKVRRRFRQSEKLMYRARRHAQKGPETTQKQARRVLHRLRGRLREVGRIAATEGIPREDWKALQPQLSEMDRSLRRMLKDTPDEHELHQVLQQAHQLHSSTLQF